VAKLVKMEVGRWCTWGVGAVGRFTIHVAGLAAGEDAGGLLGAVDIGCCAHGRHYSGVLSNSLVLCCTWLYWVCCLSAA
jgi:hypothetical protein